MAENDVEIKVVLTGDAAKQYQDMADKLKTSTRTLKDEMGKGADKVKELDAALSNTSKTAEKSSDGLLKTAKAIAGLYIVGKAKDLLVEMSGAAAESAQVTAKLNQVLITTGKNREFDIETLEKQAMAYQKTMNIEDEVIMSAQAVMLTYDNISKSTLPRMTQASLNLASVMGTDMTSAARMLGQAMQNPEQGLMMLNRQLKLFTKEETEALTAMAQTGEGAKAQEIILATLESRIDGVAEASAKAAGGGLKQLSLMFGQLKEDAGKGLNESLEGLLRGFSNFKKGLDQIRAGKPLSFYTAATQGGTTETEDARIAAERKAAMGITDKMDADAALKAQMGKIKAEKSGPSDKQKQAEAEYREWDRQLTQQMNRQRQADEEKIANEEFNNNEMRRLREADARNAQEIRDENMRLAKETGEREKEIRRSVESAKFDLALSGMNAISQLTGAGKKWFAFQKVMAGAEIIINTMRARMAALAMPFGAGIPLLPFINAQGIVAGATVAATAIKGFRFGGASGDRDTIPAMISPDEVVLTGGMQRNLMARLSGPGTGGNQTVNLVVNIANGDPTTVKNAVSAAMTESKQERLRRFEDMRRETKLLYSGA